MTKKDIRNKSLLSHYASLKTLALACGVKNPDGKKLSLALLRLETEAHKAATDYCNGTRFCNKGGDIELDNYESVLRKKVLGLFADNLRGFYFNLDARGYALKIDFDKIYDKSTKDLYLNSGIQKDWGGYGILSPQID